MLKYAPSSGQATFFEQLRNIFEAYEMPLVSTLTKLLTLRRLLQEQVDISSIRRQ